MAWPASCTSSLGALASALELVALLMLRTQLQTQHSAAAAPAAAARSPATTTPALQQSNPVDNDDAARALRLFTRPWTRAVLRWGPLRQSWIHPAPSPGRLNRFCLDSGRASLFPSQHRIAST